MRRKTLLSTNDDWFNKYKESEKKILALNKEIDELKVKEEQLKRENILKQQRQKEIKQNFI